MSWSRLRSAVCGHDWTPSACKGSEGWHCFKDEGRQKSRGSRGSSRTFLAEVLFWLSVFTPSFLPCTLLPSTAHLMPPSLPSEEGCTIEPPFQEPPCKLPCKDKTVPVSDVDFLHLNLLIPLPLHVFRLFFLSFSLSDVNNAHNAYFLVTNLPPLLPWMNCFPLFPVSADEMAAARCPSRKPPEQTSPQGCPLPLARTHRGECFSVAPFLGGKE